MVMNILLRKYILNGRRGVLIAMVRPNLGPLVKSDNRLIKVSCPDPLKVSH
jgi:hypothetical protein